MEKWKWLTPMILLIVIGGTTYYLMPTDKYDVCRKGSTYGEWVNITETVYVNDKFTAVGKYRCDLEDTELWCARATKTRCYYILEEVLIPERLKEQEKYGLSWDKTFYADKTTLTLYSGIRNVFENGKWVRIENSTGSLKKYFNVNYLKKDPDLLIDVKDFGYNWIDFEFMINSTEKLKKMIPVKVDGKEKKKFLWNNINDKRTHRLEPDNVFSHNYSFGKESTIIQLQDANTENFEDSYTDSSNANTNYGSANGLLLFTNDEEIFFKFNITAIPPTQTIDLAELCVRQSGSVDLTVGVHHVYHNGVYNISGVTWVEEDITHNLRPTGIKLNSTAESSNQVNAAFVFWCWNTTNMVTTEYNAGRTNVSMALISPAYETAAQATFQSKEWGTVAQRPYLNITYTSAVDVTPPYFSTNSTNATIPSDPVNFSIVIHDNIAVDFCLIETNNTGTFINSSWQDVSGTSANCYYETTLNSTTNKLVQWRAYGNDTSNNENVSQTFNLTVIDDEIPLYSINQTNTTLSGVPILFTLNWTDNNELASYLFSFDNGTGSLINDSVVNFEVCSNKSKRLCTSNATKIVNSTVGTVIRWAFVADDTSGNINSTNFANPFSFITTSSSTCTCPSSGDWTIDCSENCIIDADCDMQGNDIFLTNAGTIIVDGDVYNFGKTDMMDNTEICEVVLINGKTWGADR